MNLRVPSLALVLGLMALPGCGIGTQGSPLASTSTTAKALSATPRPLPTTVVSHLSPNLAYGELVLFAAMARDNAVWQMGYNLLEPGQIRVDQVPPGSVSNITTTMQGYRWDDPQENGYMLYLKGSYDGKTGKITYTLLKADPM